MTNAVWDWARDTRPFRISAPLDAPASRVIQVIEVRGKRGKGDDESDPVREVVHYFGLDGEWLAESDPLEGSR